jgi:hypothetical protein
VEVVEVGVRGARAAAVVAIEWWAEMWTAKVEAVNGAMIETVERACCSSATHGVDEMAVPVDPVERALVVPEVWLLGWLV